MAIYDEIKKVDLNQKYSTPILGLGEVYEIMSVERLRKNLLSEYKTGQLFLATNKEHSGQGISLAESKNDLKKQGLNILKAGFVDSPPFRSRPLSLDQKRSYVKNSLMVFLAKIIFWFLIRIEFLWKGPRRSHMIYCLVKK